MGFRNAFRRKRIAAFTVLSIAISVSLLYTAFSASSNLQSSANDFLRSSLSPVDIGVSGNRWGQPITEELKISIDALPSVVNSVPRIEEFGVVQLGEEQVHIFLIGLDMNQESHIGSLNTTEGVLDLSENHCFITEQAKGVLNASVGDSLGINLSAGLHFLNITGIGHAIDKGIAGPVVFVSLEKAWDIFHIKYPDNSFNRLLVEVNDIFEIPRTVFQIETIGGDILTVTNLKAYHLQLANMFLNQARLILVALVMVAVVIASFRVFSSFASIFGARKFETGVVLAFGSSRSSVLSLMLSEIGTIGLIGAVFGAILGVFVGYVVLSFVVLVSQIMTVAPTAQIFGVTSVVDVWSLLLSMVVGIGLTLAAGYMPAWRASRESVVRSLSAGTIPSSHDVRAFSPSVRKRISQSVGGVGIVLSILVSIQIISDVFSLYIVQEDFLRILSVPGYLLLVMALSPRLFNSRFVHKPFVARASAVVRSLSSKNLRRNTLSAFVVFNLFTAVTVLFFASTNMGYVITESWKRNVSWQTTSANVVSYFDEPVPLEVLEQVQAMNNVTEAVAVNQALEWFAHATSYELGLVLGAQPEGLGRMAALALTESLNASRGLSIVNDPDTCVISDYGANALNAELGDILTVDDTKNVTVVGICTSAVPAFILSIVEPIFIIVGIETWSTIEEEPFMVSSLLIESSDPVRTLADLENLPGANPMMVSQLEADYTAALQSVQVIADSSLIALFIATTASAMLSGWAIASARRREIGMLAAQGMNRTDIARTLTIENAVAMTSGVIVGSVVGILVELALADILIRAGGSFLVLVDIRTIALVLFSLLVSIAASYIAVGNATKTDVVKLLRDQGRNE